MADAFQSEPGPQLALASGAQPMPEQTSALPPTGRPTVTVGRQAQASPMAPQSPMAMGMPDELRAIFQSPPAARAHLEKVAEAPKPEDYQKNSMAFFGAMSLLGALAGKWTRAGGTASLDAFASGLKGWQEGNLQAYNNAMKNWEQETKRTIENNNVEIEKYREVIDNYKLNIDQKMAALNVLSNIYQNGPMADMTASGNFIGAFQMRDKMDAAGRKANSIVDWFTRQREAQYAQFGKKIDVLNQNPQLASQMKPDDLAQLAAVGETIGHPLKIPQNFGMKFGRASSPQALAMQKFMTDNPGASYEEIVEAGANAATAISAGRALGTRYATTGFFASEAQGAFDLAAQASDAVPRGKFVPLNRWQQAGLAATSDPKFRQFFDANAAAITAYSQTMSRTGANTVHAQQRASEVLSVADSPEAYRAGLEQLDKEIEVVTSAPEHAQKAIFDRIFKRGTVAAPQPAVGGGGAPSGGGNKTYQWTPEGGLQ